MSGSFPFLRLPLELREAIYGLYFNPADRLRPHMRGGGQYKFEFDLLRTNKQIYYEALTVFRRENVFIRIETPWAETVTHIAIEGSVPIVASGPKALNLQRYHALVSVTAPVHGFDTPSHVFVILLKDLHLFCRIWFYSSLNYPDLNRQLWMSFTLRDPYYPADPKPIPLSLQRKLLLPFQSVKELSHIEFDGYDDVVKQELLDAMEVPYATVEQCCENAFAAMEKGDEAIAKNDPTTALECYKQAFHAIHIIISGRQRHVHGDTFFHRELKSGPYKGQSGTTVRIILRLKLVGRTIDALLRRGDYVDAVFWGIRSIKIMDEAVDTEFEDFLTAFSGPLDVGLIYLRTAIGWWKLESTGDEAAEEFRDEVLGGSLDLFRAGRVYFKTEGDKEIWRRECDRYERYGLGVEI